LVAKGFSLCYLPEEVVNKTYISKERRFERNLIFQKRGGLKRT
jgi:hypothetical protein